MKILLWGKAFRFSNLLGILVLLFLSVVAACAFPLTPPSTTPAAGDQAQSGNLPEATQPASEEPTASASPATVQPSTAQPLPTTSNSQEAITVAETANAGGVETHKGIPVGFTAEGYPYRGSPDAPITMYEYSDFQCPYCNRYFIQTEPALDESYVRSGEVRVIFRDFPLVELHPNAPPAHVAALCIADQGAALYWTMHARLFQTQSEWNQLPDPASYFAELAAEVGADMDQYSACMTSGEKEAVVAQGIEEAREQGFSGTPSFLFVREATDEAFPLVGAQPYDQFAGMIDTLVAGGTPRTADQAQGNDEIPFWATAEGLQPDPERPGMTMAGDYYRGNPEAKVVVVEFSDLQCPFCRQHTLETQPILDEQFVATDQILWVFKHFPLTIHPQAPAAGVAAECAADQGKFWEMHDLLFKNIQTWSIADPNPIFVDLAQQLELNLDQFAPCLESESAAQRVQEDLEAGTPFVRGTPTFIVLYNEQGSIIPGALPADRFTSILQEVLDSVAQ